MERCRVPWVPIGLYGFLWVPMGSSGFLISYGFLWILKGFQKGAKVVSKGIRVSQKDGLLRGPYLPSIAFQSKSTFGHSGRHAFLRIGPYGFQ